MYSFMSKLLQNWRVTDWSANKLMRTRTAKETRKRLWAERLPCDKSGASVASVCVIMNYAPKVQFVRAVREWSGEYNQFQVTRSFFFAISFSRCTVVHERFPC